MKNFAKISLFSIIFFLSFVSFSSASDLFTYSHYNTYSSDSGSYDYYKETRNFEQTTSDIDDEAVGYHRSLTNIKEQTSIEKKNYPEEENKKIQLIYVSPSFPKTKIYQRYYSYPQYYSGDSYIVHHQLTCDKYGYSYDCLDAPQSSFRFRPTYNQDYYYKPVFDKNLGYFNWRY